MRRNRLEAAFRVLAILVVCGTAGCMSSNPAHELPQIGPGVTVSTQQLDLPSGPVRFDLYQPATSAPAPLVILAHGLWRDRTRMAGWGQVLARQGFVAVAMDMPTLADYQHNGRSIDELIDALCSGAIVSCKVDAQRIGLVGHSAGGLATFLAAAENPKVKIWVGLDPVDRHGIGAAVGSRVGARAVVVRAPPSNWNQHGNATTLLKSLRQGGSDTIVEDAIHIDPEWPSDWTMEFLMGQTSEQRRDVFVHWAVGALNDELMPDRTVRRSGVQITDANQ
jgi:pimeloyl-ACP methyl ester carboxylesterase